MTAKRPTDATAAGGIVVGVSLMALMPAIGGLLAHLAVGDLIDEELPPALRWLFDHYRELAAAQAVIASAALAVGIAVLKRVRWARRASQWMMMAAGLLVISYGIWMASWMSGAPDEPERSLFLLVWRSAAVGSAVSFAVPIFLSVWLLGRTTVRRWFEDA